jgi:ATP-dependent DNA helicase RecG
MPPTTPDRDLTALLAAGPSERVAFVPAGAGPARLAETLTALANSHGGALLIGVTPAGRPTGLPNPAETLAAVEAALLLPMPPLILPRPRLLEAGGQMVCLVEAPPGLPHAYSLNGRYLVRTAKENRLLSSAELTSLLLQRGETGFETRPAAGATLADLDTAAIDRYLTAAGGLAGSDWRSALLARGGLTQAGDDLAPTYAGILLFGRQPQRFVRSAEIILVRYAGPQMGDEFVRHDAAGTLPDQIRQAEAFITANVRHGMKIRGFTREEITEYPLPVVREAIVNAIAHRDYAIRGEGVRVLIFSDHMEIYSPGRLPGHVTLDNLLQERFSRNGAIVQALADLGFVERLGYGIDRMMAAMAEAGLPPPLFEETAAGFRVTLRGQGDLLVSREATGQAWGNRRLNPRQERALAYLAEHGTITNREFRELFPDLSDETIRRELAELVDQGLIMKVGERKATYYILK